MGLGHLSAGVAALALVLFYALPIEYINPRYVKVKTLQGLQPQYEYIIVGGGAAGVLLASRLSEDPNTFVLLLEEGHQLPWYAHVTSLRRFFDPKQVSRGYNTTTSSNREQPEQLEYWNVLGGTGSSGDIVYDIPSSSEWDAWAEDRSISDVWSWNQIADMLSATPSANQVETEIGTASMDNITDILRRAAIKEGYKISDEISKRDRTGFSSALFWRKADGASASVLDYLTPEVQSRFNLHILEGAKVTKIQFSLDGEATGVSYMYGGRLQRVLINKEVIVSAGAIGTPHLLLLSGIGPEQQLKQFDIPLVRSLPAVGEQLSAPLKVMIDYKTTESCSNEEDKSFIDRIFDLFCDKPDNIAMLHSICERQRASSSKSPTLTAMISTSATSKSSNPDLHVSMTPNCVQSKWYLSVQMTLLNSYRSGSVRLQSSDPSISPLIEIQSREPFKELLVKAVKRVHNLLTSDSFGALNMQISKNQDQLLKCGDTKSVDELLSCLVLKGAETSMEQTPSHTSSCAMGNMLANSVVNKRFKVHEVKRLRVIDASVLPSTASAKGSLASVLMIAERAPQMIKEDISG